MKLAATIFMDAVFAYFLLFLVVHFALFCISARAVVRRLRVAGPHDLANAGMSPITPTVTILVPAYCEEACIVGSVRSLLDLRYLRRDIVVIDDGSTDATFERLHDAFDLVEVEIGEGLPLPTAELHGLYISRLHPDLWVVCKANGGRSDALNAGINFARGDLVCVIDADSVLEPDAIEKVVQPFVDDPAGTVAAGGIVRIANGSTFDGGRLTQPAVSRNPIAAIQTLEYLRGFLGGRVAWERMNSLLIISGAFGMFRRDVLAAMGGFSTTTMGEDMELIVRMHRVLRPRWKNFRVAFAPEAVCWTEAPEKVRDLRSQRLRWHVGLLEVLTRHRSLAFSRRSGVGVGWGSFLFAIVFEAAGPLIEALGYVVSIVGWAMGWINPAAAIAFFVVAILAGTLLSISGLFLEEIGFGRYRRARDLGALAMWALLENFGYRQLATWWRVVATVRFITGRKPGWDRITRTERFDDVEPDVVEHGSVAA